MRKNSLCLSFFVQYWPILTFCVILSTHILYSACHETELSIKPDSIHPDEKLSIGVIGSGPAGMAFAYTAATIGHHVTLFDKSDEIGGN